MVIEESSAAPGFFHVAGIDSPGLAGSPAIALEVVALLKRAGKAEPAPSKAEKVTGTPGLPWTKPDGTQDAEKIIAYMTEQMSSRLSMWQKLPGYLTIRILPLMHARGATPVR